MLKQTPLYLQHVQANAQLVNFSGWEMPLHYGSQLEEHHCIRQTVGMFDVSHMGVVDIHGADAYYFLRFLLANDIQKLKAPGQALYTCMLNHQGGVVDDLITFQIEPDNYRLVVNAGSREKVFAWINQHIDRYDIHVYPREDLAIIAIQGPRASAHVEKMLEHREAAEQVKAMRLFHSFIYADMQIARTGYTGEDGFEIILPADQAQSVWKSFLEAGVKPCGLGARDTLRLEAGFNLYGSDMDETTTPLESNLAWTVSWKDGQRNFIGKTALLEQLEVGVDRRLVGLFMPERGVLRNHQKVYFSKGEEGEITSGGFSPTLGCAIALARVPVNSGGDASVDRYGKKVLVAMTQPPFIKDGKKAF